MNATRSRWAAAAIVVALGWVLTPHTVPVYDGIAQPDDPCRYATATITITQRQGHHPVSNGASATGLSLSTS